MKETLYYRVLQRTFKTVLQRENPKKPESCVPFGFHRQRDIYISRSPDIYFDRQRDKQNVRQTDSQMDSQKDSSAYINKLKFRVSALCVCRLALSDELL